MVHKCPAHQSAMSVSRMATVAALSPEIEVLEENTLSNAQQPLMIDTLSATAVTPLLPCIQYEDAAEYNNNMENVFQVTFIVNSKAQEESLPNSEPAHHEIDEQALQGGVDHSPQGEGVNQANRHESLEEESQLQADTGCKDPNETTNMLGWFHSTFSEIERNGIVTLKDFKEIARHSDVSRLEQIRKLV